MLLLLEINTGATYLNKDNFQQVYNNLNNNNFFSFDSDSDKDIMTERPNKCYIFENDMTQGYQI